MKKDLGWNVFLSDDERFADLINGLGCGGQQIVKEKDICEMDTKAAFKWFFGKKMEYVSGTRDLLRRVALGINFMIVGVEGQENMDYEYPLRDLKYEAAEYDKQLRKIRKALRKNKSGLLPGEYLYRFRKADRLKPVVTFLLYAGEEPWDGPLSLWDILDFTDIPESLANLVPNHRVNVVDIRRLKNTDIFKTDVKEIFDYIRYSNDKEKLCRLVEEDEYFKCMDEDAFDLVTSYLDDDNLKIQKEKYAVDGGGISMCTAIRELIEDGRAEGREEGREEGRVMVYISLGFTADEIAQREHLDVDKVRGIIDRLGN